MSDWKTILIASLGVLFIGIAKAGFGGGLGMLTTPICVLPFAAGGKAPSFAVGTLPPLLRAGDVFSMYHYRGRWERRNLKFLLPGVVAGVQMVGRFRPNQLNFAIGLIAVLFVLFQFVKDRVFRAEGVFAPNHRLGIPCGIAAVSKWIESRTNASALFIARDETGKFRIVTTSRFPRFEQRPE